MKFPDIRLFSNYSAPCRIECDIHALEVVEGEIPKNIKGTFYRAQPDPAWPPKYGQDIPLNGDGMVTTFSFENGYASYKSRYVRTPKFEAERKAGKALFGIYRNPYTDDPSVKGISGGTANTNLLYHSGRLLALKEDSLPIEIDPQSLETIGVFDFSSGISSQTFTAHPKVDPEDGTLYAIGYEATGLASKDIAIYRINSKGEKEGEVYIEAPYACMVHDFGISENHIIIPISPLCSDLEKIKQGNPHFEWRSDLPCYLGVISKKDFSQGIKWFVGDNAFSSHTLNAWEEDGKIHYETPVGEIVVFPFFPSANGEKWDAEKALPYLERWSVDLNSNDNRIHRERLFNTVLEFPRIDERYTGKKTKFAWVASEQQSRSAEKTSLGGGLSLNSVSQLDLKNKTIQTWFAGDPCAVQEPLFVPKNEQAQEGDGYVFVVVNDLSVKESFLMILDTQDIEKGPVAKIRMPIRLRGGLHGIWI